MTKIVPEQTNPIDCDTISVSAQESIAKATQALSDAVKSPRTVTRPDFSPRKGLCKSLAVLCLFVGAYFALQAFSFSAWWLLPVVAATVLFNAKKIVVWSILAYQRYAPEKLRAACLFTPSCSEYMLLAIAKYGLCKGICKGIGRLFRCHYPNGGEDYP